jgi:hypothetical protein
VIEMPFPVVIIQLKLGEVPIGGLHIEGWLTLLAVNPAQEVLS